MTNNKLDNTEQHINNVQIVSKLIKCKVLHLYTDLRRTSAQNLLFISPILEITVCGQRTHFYEPLIVPADFPE